MLFVMDPGIREELIKHLSKEIEKNAEYISTLRSRMAFTVMGGPFLVLGSLAFGNKGTSTLVKLGLGDVLCPLLLLAITYTGIADVASRLDKHALWQSDQWRLLIQKIAKDNDPILTEMQSAQDGIELFYISFYMLTYFSFVVAGYLLLVANGMVK